MGDGNICKVNFFNPFAFSKGSTMGTFEFYNQKKY